MPGARLPSLPLDTKVRVPNGPSAPAWPKASSLIRGGCGAAAAGDGAYFFDPITSEPHSEPVQERWDPMRSEGLTVLDPIASEPRSEPVHERWDPMLSEGLAVLDKSPVITGVSPDVAQRLQAQLCSTIPAPLLLEQPRLHVPRRRAVDNTHSPARRSGRLAAKSRSRASNTTVQAQNVIRAKWGLTKRRQQPAAEATDEFEQYLELFCGGLSASKCEAIRKLFPAGSGIDGIQLVEGVELKV